MKNRAERKRERGRESARERERGRERERWRERERERVGKGGKGERERERGERGEGGREKERERTRRIFRKTKSSRGDVSYGTNRVQFNSVNDLQCERRDDSGVVVVVARRRPFRVASSSSSLGQFLHSFSVFGELFLVPFPKFKLLSPSPSALFRLRVGVSPLFFHANV